MALLDTIKPTKGHKPFPYSPPTITTNNSPSGALILEIIFSASDSTGTACPTDSLEEESDAEEDDSSDDDVSDASTENEDSEGDNQEDSDDDEEDEEDGNEEGSDESDCEGEEVDDSEDFGNGGFDDDLIIDFSNGNDDDELVVEFEEEESPAVVDTPLHKSPSREAASKKNTLPFWFNDEEQDQIRMIFESYALTMDIEEQRKACIRSPAPFIGRVTRTPLKPADNDTDKGTKEFKTLDKVEVYLRELYPLGTLLPLSRVAWVLTSWDSCDGIPTSSVELSKSAKKSMQKRTETGQSSTLYCAPIFRTKEDYKYTVSSAEHSLMYASSSSTNTSISLISPFLPEHCRNISFSLD